MNKNAVWIRNGHVIDPASGVDKICDIIVTNGKIAHILSSEEALTQASGLPEYNAKGMLVTPGLIDIHVHLREPGDEEEETIESGCQAAVRGGFTTLACMPNTEPAVDSESAIRFIRDRALDVNLANVYPVGAITKGRAGLELSEMAGMARSGAIAFSDDGTAVPTAGLLRKALLYSRMLNLPILEHCEDKSLAGGGCMNEGTVATVLGLPGIPDEAESVVIARDISMSRLANHHVHIQHISTEESVRMLATAKQDGLKVTAEVTPHHLVLCEEDIGRDPYNSVLKVNPPLRRWSDVEACRKALADGIIDCVASDHAPHLPEEKELEFIHAPCGMIGLETTVGVLLTKLVNPGLLSIQRLIEALTIRPAQILNIPHGTLTPGAAADITIIDPNYKWKVDAEKFASHSNNCPFNGWELTGAAVATFFNGRKVFDIKDNT